MNLMFWRRRNDDATSTAEDLVLEQLSAYLDGELTDAETAEVESLIARDAAAAEVLGDLRLMRSAFGALGEVRAPRSFAIPATAAPRPASVTVGLFRRTEMFMRASAAVAALFFVVAVVNDPGGSTPVARQETSVAFDTAAMSASESGPAFLPTEQTEKGEGEVGAASLAAPAPADGDTPANDGETGESGANATGPDEGGGADAQQGDALAPVTGSPLPEGAPVGGGVGGGIETPAGASSPGDAARSTEELRPVPAGTEFVVDSSQGAGGMALALGVLAALLTALSALTAWDRRSGGQTR